MWSSGQSVLNSESTDPPLDFVAFPLIITLLKVKFFCCFFFFLLFNSLIYFFRI